MKQNIVFSTTRQWNPGDEFILMGVRKILDSIGIEYNPLIFNRNPDIRSCFQDLQYYRASKLPEDFWQTRAGRLIDANVKYGHFDNSMKPDSQWSAVDWAILAGTPEWCNGKLHDLYSHVRAHNIPMLILGVGGGVDLYRPEYMEVISRAKLITAREEKTLNAMHAQGLQATQLPCPALLAAPASYEKNIGRPRCIGLIYQASRQNSLIWNGSSQQTQDLNNAVITKAVKRFSATHDIKLICHYIDEVAEARHHFPDLAVAYSYDAADYLEIYHECDLIYGPRVHGIGLAASMGIAGVALSHDSRGSTCEGFLAQIVEPNNTPAQILDAIEDTLSKAGNINRALRAHKANTHGIYCELVSSAMHSRHVEYPQQARIPTTTRYELEELQTIADALIAQQSGETKNPEVLARLINIELKINRLLELSEASR